MHQSLSTDAIDGCRAPAAQFSLDSHHLAVLDRFVARARRHARGAGRPFTGVVVVIDNVQSVSVHAAGLESLVLKEPPARGGSFGTS
jgi:hypothetical protein